MLELNGIWYLIAFALSAISMVIIMPSMISYLHKIKFGQTEREEGLESHKVKNGTPTMGGITFIFVSTFLYLIFSFMGIVPLDMKIGIILLAFIGYGIIGFIDDYIIVVRKNNEGLRPAAKFALQSVLAIVFFLLYRHTDTAMDLWIPMIDVHLPLGFLYFVLVFFMFTAETNAVNLTDGLDGLCAGQMVIALIPFVFFAIRMKNQQVAFLIVLLIGSLVGYLKFNKHPAQIFMGDTGSLALGGFLAAVAMVLKQEVLLVFIGGVFVAEVLSVVIQVSHYKRTKRRIFRMAPLHHHFEKGGWSETKVVYRFWLVGAILSVLGYMIGVM